MGNLGLGLCFLLSWNSYKSVFDYRYKVKLKRKIKFTFEFRNSKKGLGCGLGNFHAVRMVKVSYKSDLRFTSSIHTKICSLIERLFALIKRRGGESYENGPQTKNKNRCEVTKWKCYMPRRSLKHIECTRFGTVPFVTFFMLFFFYFEDSFLSTNFYFKSRIGSRCLTDALFYRVLISKNEQ